MNDQGPVAPWLRLIGPRKLVLDTAQPQPLPLQIAAKIAGLIRTGLLSVGDELPSERDLAAIFEVSRETGRGALKLLASSGIAGITQGARPRVIALPCGVEPDPQPAVPPLVGLTSDEVFVARCEIEPRLIARAADRIDSAGRARLRRLLVAQQAMFHDSVRFQISDQEFHFTLHEYGGNRLLAAQAGQVYSYAFAFRREVMAARGGVARAWEGHRRIVEALDDHDGDGASAAMLAHIQEIAALAREARTDPADCGPTTKRSRRA